MEFDDLLKRVFEEEELVLITLSSPLITSQAQKASIRPLLIKGVLHFQLTEQRQTQAIHQNLSKNQCRSWLATYLLDYKQTFIYTKSADYQVLVNKKQKITILKKAPTKSQKELSHNRSKHYLLEEGTLVPFMVKLGVMTNDGKIIAKKSDKFRQVNRFLEMVEDVISHLDAKKTIRVIDFGCGKAYLSFALFHYLKIVKGFSVKMIGLDLKTEVVEFCNHLAHELGFAPDLEFLVGDINTHKENETIDMVVSLHACDTATDAALEKAIHWQAKVILCVPCCQHELFGQVKCDFLVPLLKHGILKERFAALATDAMRAELLELVGYTVQVLEFIDMEHTPKNLLIRAVKGKNKGEKDREAYMEMKGALHVNPSLERRLVDITP